MQSLKNILFSKNTFYLLAGFIGIRAVSFFIRDQLVVQGILVFVILMIFGAVFYKKPVYAWLFLVTEFLLGGTGHLLELGGLSLRTILVLAFLFMWYTQTIAKKDTLKHIKELSPVSYLMIVLMIYIWFAGINGIIHGHAINAIIQDLIPFVFFFLLPPAVHFLRRKKYYPYYVRLVSVFIIGMAIFSALTYLLFSAGIVELQEPYYKWFRDIVSGKITNLGNGFWRVVSPEHLFLTPMILVLASLLMKRGWNTCLRSAMPGKLINKNQASMLWILLFSLILIFVLNLSRTYILGLLIGLLILKYKHTWRSWLFVSGTTLASIFIIFSGIHFVSSGFTTPGWDLFGLRIASVARPDSERSAATRKELLSPIIEQIRERPLLGSGLGATVIFVDPVTYNEIETRQFDWGYLEMWTELGFVGLALFTIILLFIFYRLLKYTKTHRDFSVGLLAALISIIAMNLTTPILFHVFGVLFVVFLLSYVVDNEFVFKHKIESWFDASSSL